MASEFERAIQQHVMSYLASKESLAEFENWFAPLFWDIDHEDKSTRDLAGTVHVLVSEFYRGDRTLQDLHAGLGGAISHPTYS